MQKGKLILIPVPLGDGDIDRSLVPALKNAIGNMGNFVVENEKTARRFLKMMEIITPQSDLQIQVYGKHSRDNDLKTYLKPIDEGRDVGLLSEAGCPAVADPGALIVRKAHALGIRVQPFVGPSSILLSLMASGFNGQQFAFVGYLPIKRPERIKGILELEQRISRFDQTQIFIEAPYRNNQLLEDILKTCRTDTQLSISCDLTTDTELVATKSIAEWIKQKPDLHKRPAIFLLYK